VTEDDYRTLLTMARRANLNALRVWGGGLREKRAFYDLCDRLGCWCGKNSRWRAPLSRIIRARQAYLELVEAETREIVRQVRNHPSVMLWCGGNEFNLRTNQPVVEAMRRAVLAEDGTRPFQPVSPACGDRHNWHIWHLYRPPEEYREDMAQVMSEFGLQSPPALASLQRFIPPDELWPPGQAGRITARRGSSWSIMPRPFGLLIRWRVCGRQPARSGARIQIAVEHRAAGNMPRPVSWSAVKFALARH